MCDAFRRRIALRGAYRMRRHSIATVPAQGVPDRATQLAFARDYRIRIGKNIMSSPIDASYPDAFRTAMFHGQSHSHLHQSQPLRDPQ
jgi:hypothetical protein